MPSLFFFFNDTATTEIYTLSLHDALPISTPAFRPRLSHAAHGALQIVRALEPARLALCHDRVDDLGNEQAQHRSEEHTSELQSLAYLVCRLLLEKKKIHSNTY